MNRGIELNREPLPSIPDVDVGMAGTVWLMDIDVFQ